MNKQKINTDGLYNTKAERNLSELRQRFKKTSYP